MGDVVKDRESILGFFRERSLDKSIPVPLYYQMKEILVEYVRRSPYGAPLPTEEQLCAVYQVSRPTVRQAVRELETSGSIVKIKRKGTFVAQPKIQQNFFFSTDRFEDGLLKTGQKLSIEVLDFKRERCEDKYCQMFNLDLGNEIFILNRLLSVNELPLVRSLSYLPCRHFEGVHAEDFNKAPLGDIIQKDFGYNIVKIKKTLEAKLISDYESELFKVKKGVPVQYVETISYLEGDVPIEITMERYRADKTQFTFIIAPKAS